MTLSLEEYRVELDVYAGPLDLLLFLVRRQEIDLNDLPIARLTEQYLQHVKSIEHLDVNLAGEFLVMAATLLEIKSQMLLPRPEEAAGSADDAAGKDAGLSETDPRYELVQQLLAYKRFKDAALELDDRKDAWERRFPVRPGKVKPSSNHEGADGEEGQSEQVEFDLDDVSITDLCDAFQRILDSIGQRNFTHNVVYDDTPIELHAADIVDRLQREGRMTLQSIFVGRSNRTELVGLFLATLELVRQKRLAVKQDAPGGEIHLELRPDAEQLRPEDDVAHDWRDPQTGEMQYDWPDEAARRAAQRRARLRAKLRVAKLQRGKDGQEIDEDALLEELEAQEAAEAALAEAGEGAADGAQAAAATEAEAVVDDEPYEEFGTDGDDDDFADDQDR